MHWRIRFQKMLKVLSEIDAYARARRRMTHVHALDVACTPFHYDVELNVNPTYLHAGWRLASTDLDWALTIFWQSTSTLKMPVSDRIKSIHTTYTIYSRETRYFVRS